jgi:hypothetical protein
MTTACESDDFRCNNTVCIKNSFKCDGKNDCGDNIDEASCEAHDVVVDMGSSKSQMWVITSRDDQIIKMEKTPKIRTEVNGEKTGLAGACESDEAKCKTHIDELVKSLEYNTAYFNSRIARDDIRMIKFLGTAGFRQSDRGDETLEKLKKAVEENVLTHAPWSASLLPHEIECRTLTTKEEAENEFLSFKSIVKSARNHDEMAPREKLGLIGLGGASVQYGIEEVSGGKTNIDSEPFGADKAWDKLEGHADGNKCKVGGSSTFNECTAQVQAVFDSENLFDENTKGHWEDTDVKVYVTGGGILFSLDKKYSTKFNFKDSHGNDVPKNMTLSELEAAAKDRCQIPGEPTTDINNNSDDYAKYQCFRLVYIRYLLTKLGAGGKTIHFRKKVNGRNRDWPRAVVMKYNKK